MRVKVYYNLHRHCWSVLALEGPDKGRVVDHCDRVVLDNPRFRVGPKGNQRVRDEGKKNVHAYVYGVRVPQPGGVGDTLIHPCTEVYYNPYKHTQFMTADGVPVYTARTSILYNKRVFIPNQPQEYRP